MHKDDSRKVSGVINQLTALWFLLFVPVILTRSHNGSVILFTSSIVPA